MSIAYVNAVLELQLPPAQKHLLTVLAFRLNNDSGTCNPSLHRLMRDTGLSRSGVQKQLRALLQSKLITANRHKRRSTIYTLLKENFARFLGAHEESLNDEIRPQEAPQRLTRNTSEAHEESPEQELKGNKTTTTERRRDVKLPKAWTEQEQKAVVRKLSELSKDQAQSVIDVAEHARSLGQIRRGIVPFVIGLSKAAQAGTLDTSEVQRTRKPVIAKPYSMSPHIARQILGKRNQINGGDSVLIAGYGIAMSDDIEKARAAMGLIKKSSV